MAIPSGYMLAVFSRSSAPKKKGVMLPHGVGVIDSDYCGPDDEIWIQVMNFTDVEVTIKRGEKIAQGVLLPVVQAEWQEVDEMTAANRGGRGTTGGYHDSVA
jgi:dUTP pyrophosphatase